MSAELKFCDRCTVQRDIADFKKVGGKTVVRVPAGKTVTVVSVSANMAIVQYLGKSYPTRIDNLELKKEEEPKEDGAA